jgi:DnaJ-class molecular chaperone
MTGRDHYEVLGVARGASDGDIRRAYRALALRCHPDVYSGADAGRQFREIANAYEVLNDPVERARYDATSRPREVRHSCPDAPRFVDAEVELRIRVDDLIGALLHHMSATGSATWMPVRRRSVESSPSRPFWTTEVLRWR